MLLIYFAPNPRSGWLKRSILKALPDNNPAGNEPDGSRLAPDLLQSRACKGTFTIGTIGDHGSERVLLRDKSRGVFSDEIRK